MGKLLVKLLSPDAKAPTVAHAGDDLGFDLYASKDVFLEPLKQVVVPTGISAIYTDWDNPGDPPQGHIGFSGGWYARADRYGLEVEDRSGMAAKNGIHILAGKIDAGYRGDIGVVMILLGPPQHRSMGMLARMAEGNRYAGWSKDAVLEQLGKDTARDIETARIRFGYYCAAEEFGYQIKAGDKIAQMMPRRVRTGGEIEVVESLPEGARGDKGYGSTGK